MSSTPSSFFQDQEFKEISKGFNENHGAPAMAATAPANVDPSQDNNAADPKAAEADAAAKNGEVKQPRKKRNKPSLVCSNCKRRKIRCDRKLPCTSCIKMKCANECTYDGPRKPKWQTMAFEGKTEPSHSSMGPVGGSSALPPARAAAAGRDNGGTVGGVTRPYDTLFTPPAAQAEIFKSEQWTAAEPANFASNASAEKHSKPAVDEKTPVDADMNSFLTSSYEELHSRDPTLGYNPVGSPDEEINFYDDYNPFHVKEPFRRVNHGALSWAVFMKKDPWMLVTWQYSVSEREGFPFILFTGATEITNENIKDLNADGKSKNPDILFKKRALEIDGYDEVAPLSKLRNKEDEPQVQPEKDERVPPQNVHRQEPTTHPKKSGARATAKAGKTETPAAYTSIKTLNQSLFQGKVNRELLIVNQIRAAMPKKKVVWKLIARYFSHLYAFMPFLDEVDFKAKISKIIGPESFDDVPVEDIKIVNKLDLANVSILFIVLRLTYCSLFDNKVALNEKIMNEPDQDPQNDDLRYLMLHPINLSLVDVAKNCLNKFQFSRKTNLTVFQGFFFVRLYNTYAPEEGDGHDGGDSRVSTGMLIQSAYNLGLNREPDKFNDVFNDAKQNSLTRKLWYCLVREDLTSCLSVGNHYSILDKYYDTKPPFYKEGNANVSKIDLELATIQIYKWFITRTENLRKLVDMVSDVRGKTKISDYANAISVIEKEASTEYTFDGPYTGIRTELMIKTYAAMRVKIVLYLKSSLISLLYHLFLYYEDKLNYELSFYYLKKIYCISLYYILPSAFDVLCGKHSKDALTLNPSLQLAMHKGNQVNLAAAVRIGYLVYSLESASDHKAKLSNDKSYYEYFNKLQELYRRFIKYGELFARTFAKLAQKYYYAWRISRAHFLLSQTLTTKQFYQSLPNNVKKMRSFQFSTQQLDELSKIARSTIKGLEQIVNFEELQKTPQEFYVPHSSISSSTGSPPGSDPFSKKNGTFHEGNSSDASFYGNEENRKNGANAPTVSQFSMYPESGEISTLSNQNLDQMWMQMLAMKYNPNQNGNVTGASAENVGGPTPGQPQQFPQANEFSGQQTNPDQQNAGAEMEGGANGFGGGYNNGFAGFQDPLAVQQQSLAQLFDNEMTFDIFDYPLDPIL